MVNRWRGQKELKTTGMVMLDLRESQKLDVVFLLLEPMDRGFFIRVLCVSPVRLRTRSLGDDLPGAGRRLLHLYST